ncbi:divergent CRAL/TRIO domain protein (macronuclear) [Tetrahymena thermophila SB210]|uniref:Divergent CRAL/TRIO domain protein n=1 Tax=Tetrahymena thermophila (strain SB210) TaxID=312017 RepID=Q22GI4_TETTS|nr:divergent CRAL/TRIO domain protein [Tetrahymena thermophila SB210]EAR84347.2 divergent CRAL/TRIO domain protein [Tetrahymena thermophila SB210]|eukprot:XP_001032010.2 divergent CRAL/TRIO domain protein [Tetrahymena thermophila SB210]
MSIDNANLDYLKLPHSILQTINHPQDYIQGYGKDKKPFRKIFKNTEYNQKEKQAIQQLKLLVSSNKVALPQNFDDSDYLKFVYTGKFDDKKSLEALTKNLNWRNSMKETISKEAFMLLESGVFYQYGRDNQYRPVVIINIHKIDPNHNSEKHTLEALCYFLKKIQSYMFYPGKIENWIIILETNKMSFFKFPIGILKMIIQTLSVNFNATLEHLFILNPSTSFNVVWGGASGFIDSAQKEKISFISSKKEINKLHQKVELNQLEKKYGGYLEDLTQNFWPPKNTIIKVTDPSVLECEDEFMRKKPENQLDIKQSQLEVLKDFSKNIDGRISVLKTKPEKTKIENPLEDQLMKKSIVPTSSYYSIRPSVQQLYDQQGGDRISMLSGYSRPSNRTIYKSAFSSFKDVENQLPDDIQEEDGDAFYSFHSFNENQIQEQAEEKKQWQKWSVIGQEAQKTNNNSSTHKVEDKQRISQKASNKSQHKANIQDTNEQQEKNISIQNSSNQLSENNPRSTNESRQSKKTVETKERESAAKENSISSENLNSKIENNSKKSRAGERYGKESFTESNVKQDQKEKDEQLSKRFFCC